MLSFYLLRFRFAVSFFVSVKQNTPLRNPNKTNSKYNPPHMFTSEIQSYLDRHGYLRFQLKGVLFDMDGVLFNSMPYHASAWHKAMKNHGLTLSKEEAYLHEGRTGAGTIDIVMQREQNRKATPAEIEAIYQDKSTEFNKYPDAAAMPGSLELLQQIRKDGLLTGIVTGSGQKSLLTRIEENFPALFDPHKMVTAFDVTHGKPHPEPYLMGLKKTGLKPFEAIVIENAPLGVAASRAAGIFTVAVNTGPMPDEVLLEAGADLLFPSMTDFSKHWKELYQALNRTNRKEES